MFYPTCPGNEQHVSMASLITPVVVHPLIHHTHTHTPQHRRMAKVEASYRYKKRVDVRKSQSERKAEEQIGLPVDPLEDIFDVHS